VSKSQVTVFVDGEPVVVHASVPYGEVRAALGIARGMAVGWESPSGLVVHPTGDRGPVGRWHFEEGDRYRSLGFYEALSAMDDGGGEAQADWQVDPDAWKHA
jgi:hypothetical protein